MDVDIDFQTTFDPLEYFDTAIRASMVNKDRQAKGENHGLSILTRDNVDNPSIHEKD